MKTKFVSILAASAMLIAGLTPVTAQAAGAPYTVNVLGTYANPTMELVAGNGRVFYKVGGQLWTSDGTTQTMLKDFDINMPGNLSIGQNNPQNQFGSFTAKDNYYNHSVLVGSKLYFWGYTNGTWKIWVTDGTVAGTQLFWTPGYSVGFPNDAVLPNLYSAQGNVYFWAQWKGENHGSHTGNYATLMGIKISDSSSFEVTSNSFKADCYSDDWQGNQGSLQQQFGLVNNKLVFEYSQMEGGLCVDKLAAYDPTASVSSRLVRIADPNTHNGAVVSMEGPQQFTLFNNKLYFYVHIGTTNAILSDFWSTDGTDAGTQAVLSYGSTYHGMGFHNNTAMRPTVAGSYLYFAGFDPSALNEAQVLYRTNGSTTEKWITNGVLSNGGRRSNAPAAVIGSGNSLKLLTDGQANIGLSANPEPHNDEMISVDLTSKTAVQVVETGDTYWGGLSCTSNCGSWVTGGMTEATTWDNKVWFTGVTFVDEGMAKNREIYYTDGTTAGTAKATNNETTYGLGGDGNYTIGFQGPNSYDLGTYGQIPSNAWATKPIVMANDRVFFLSANGASPSSWTLNSITRNTPPPPALTCSNQMTKLKVEAESATDLSPAFAGSTCVYTMKVDNKTSKVDFTPTFTGSINVKVGGTSVTTSLKSTKTQTVNLGGAGTDTVVDFVFGSNTYRVTITRAAPATPGGRDPGFTAPSLPNGSVKTTDKDTKKEENQNGDKKETEVTYIGGSFDGKVAKLDDNGKKDEEFSSKVPVIGGTVEVVKVDEQHRVLVGGQNVDGDRDVVRLKPDGSKDSSFSGPDLGSGKKVDDIDVKDGKIVIGGDFGDGKNVKKLKDNGTEDSSFNANIPNIPGEVKAVKIQEDDKVLIGGHFENADGDADKDKIVRLNKDGHIDVDFEPATNSDSTKKAHFNDDVEDIDVQKDGKIVVVGKSEKTNDDEADKVVRLKKDGKEDETFVFDGNIPSGKTVESVKVKDSGEVYIAGDFEDVGDGDGDKVAKVKKDGHVDTDWNPPHQGGDVHDIELEKHGKVFLGGDGSGDGDKVDKVEEDGDRDGDKPRYDSIDDDQASNKVDGGTKGQTKIHGDGFKDGTTVTIGGQPATVVKIDDRDEEITIQVPTPDNNHKGGSDHERKGADIVIHVPDGQGGHDDIEVKDGFGYVDVKEAQQIKPDNDNHINSDKDDDDHKGKVNDDEALAAHIPSDDPITHVSKTPDVCTVDDENRVHYHKRGDCKVVTDAPGDMGHADPAPVTEVIPVAGLDPELVAPTLPDWAGDVSVPEVPDTGFQIPAPTVDDPSVPIDYTSLTPEVCEVSPEGVVTAIDPNAVCTVQLTTPGTPIYEPTAPSAPPVTITIPVIAWLPPAPATGLGLPAGTVQDPDVPAVAMPAAGGTVKLGTDLGFKYDKAKGTLTPTAWGIYFGPIKATINYTWTNTNPSTLAVTSGSGTCTVNWGVLKKWSKLSKADQKKYKKPLGAKVFSTTANCKVNAAAKAALAKPGTSFSATSDVLRTRMWPATYKPEKPIIPNVRPNPVPIEPRLRHYTLTISTQ